MQVLHKILPHRGEEVHQHTLFQAHTAMRHTVLLAEGVALADLAGFAADGEAEAARGHVGDLRVGVLVQCADRALVEGVFHAHHRVAVGQHLAHHPRRSCLPFDIPVKHPLFVLVIHDHIDNVKKDSRQGTKARRTQGVAHNLELRVSIFLCALCVLGVSARGFFFKKLLFFLALFQICVIF